MITRDSSLADVCFIVSEALASSGIEATLTGGSAAAVYAPQQYMSLDADFIVDAKHDLKELSKALARIGFSRIGKGRIFGHDQTQYAVDFPKGPLSVGGDYVTQTGVLRRGNSQLRILARTDCIRDRLCGGATAAYAYNACPSFLRVSCAGVGGGRGGGFGNAPTFARLTRCQLPLVVAQKRASGNFTRCEISSAFQTNHPTASNAPPPLYALSSLCSTILLRP